MRVSEAPFSVSVFTHLVTSNTAPEFIDITSLVKESLEESGVQNGIATIFSRHTTAAISIQENEPLLLNDMASSLDRIAPKNARYGHNDFSIRTVHMEEDECPNGHSHCQHLVLGSSETVPVINGSLSLGQWQRIFVVELDEAKTMPREIVIQLMGL